MKKVIQEIKEHKYAYLPILIAVIMGVYFIYNEKKSDETQLQYKTAKVEKGTLTASVSGSGNIIVDQSATVDPTITGTIANLSVNVGDYVEKGQTLFSIVNDDLGISANQAYIAYIQSQGSLESAKANRREAKENYDDASSDDKKIMNNRLEAAEISLAAAEKSVAVSLANYQNALSDAQKRTVTAPISGTINEINIKNGDDLGRLSYSSSSSAPIIIGDLSTLKAQVQVNEVDIVNVEVGQKAILTFSAIENFEEIGKISKIDALGSTDQGVVSYDVTIDFDSLDPRIKPGMTVSASIITQVKTDVLIAPSSAVKNQTDGEYVIILKNGEQSTATVETGLSNNTQTEILNGLNEGDEIVTQTSSVSNSTNSNKNSSNNNLRIPGLGGFGR